jgi:hypothetical protein
MPVSAFSCALDVYETAFGAQFAEEEAFFCHHPYSVFGEVEVGYYAGDVDFAQEGSVGVPDVDAIAAACSEEEEALVYDLE